MIQDGIDYGEGYEKATEPGPYVQFCDDGIWKYRESPEQNLLKGFVYRQPIKPKEEKMEKPMIKSEAKLNGVWYHVTMTLDKAEKAGEEAKRIKAEIAKREEIGPGDWFYIEYNNCIYKCASVDGNVITTTKRNRYGRCDCRKLHPTPEVKAWLDSVIK